jgi:hypothetical protein
MNRTTPWRYWFMWIVSALMLAAIWPSAAARAQGSDPNRWYPVGGVASNVVLTDVILTSETRAWAVGYADATGVVYQLDLTDGRWRVSQRATFGSPLYAVAVAPNGTVWAVGDDGLIVRGLVGSQWSSEQPLAGVGLRAIQILGNEERIWVGGAIRRADYTDEPVMLRRDGSTWSRDTTIAGTGRIDGLHFAPGGGWAVGGDRIWRYQQGRWQSEEIVGGCNGDPCPAGLLAVRTLDSDTAWTVGTRHGMCAICVARPLALQRSNGAWQADIPLAPIAGWDPTPNQLTGAALTDIWFSANGQGYVVGWWINRENAAGPRPIIATRKNGSWQLMGAPDTRYILNGLSMIEGGRGLAVGSHGVILAYGYGWQAVDLPIGVPSNPTTRVPNPQQPGVAYFEPTGHTLRGSFLRYWQANGGLAQFGYPITEEFAEVNPDDGKTYTVQYFERARFEYHPEFAGTRYEVLLGLLGHTITANRKQEVVFLPVNRSNAPGTRYFPETGHTMAAEFVGYWERTGGLAVYGYPISEPFYETSPTDGQTYLVQYFERNRFEYHPELAGTQYEVLLGLLGSEVLRLRGWL